MNVNVAVESGFRTSSSDMKRTKIAAPDSVIWNRGKSKKKVSTGATVSVGCAKVGSIGMDIEDHVGSSVSNFGIRMRGHVVQELVNSVTRLFSRCTLLGGDG